MSKVGRPEKFDKNFHPRDFLEQSKQGRNIKQIAARWGVSRECVYNWGKKYKYFSDAIKRGKELCEAWYMDIGQAAMVGKATDKAGKPIKVDLGWFVWMTKNVCKWSDKITEEIDHTTNGNEISSSPVIIIPANGSEVEK